MHLVIQWPDRWLAVAGSEQAYRERVIARLSSVKETTIVTHDLPPDAEIREAWKVCEIRHCAQCENVVKAWVRITEPARYPRPGDVDEHKWESPPSAPRCPLCHPVDSLRVDKLSPVDRIRLLQELAKHKDVAEVLPVESDLAQVRFGGQSHERPRAPADVLRIAELAEGEGFAHALRRVPSAQMQPFDTHRAMLLRIEPLRDSAEIVFAVPRHDVPPDPWLSMRGTNMREPPF